MSALIIVDVQNDFTQGSLSLCNAPSKADVAKTIERINNHMKDKHYNVVVYTMDYHPDDHCSFSSWPKHCVAGTWGAELDQRLESQPTNCDKYFIIQKGTSQSVDSYSAFVDNEGKVETELRSKLLQHNIQDVAVCGLALDFCVFHTAMDSNKFGFKTTILDDCTSSYSDAKNPEFVDKINTLKCSGIQLLQSSYT